jgi:hypothetical protein
MQQRVAEVNQKEREANVQQRDKTRARKPREKDAATMRTLAEECSHQRKPQPEQLFILMSHLEVTE